MSDVRIIQVIRTRLLTRGRGEGGDPVRIIEQYWDMDGKLLFEFDTWNGEVYAPIAERSVTGVSPWVEIPNPPGWNPMDPESDFQTQVWSTGFEEGTRPPWSVPES